MTTDPRDTEASQGRHSQGRALEFRNAPTRTEADLLALAADAVPDVTTQPDGLDLDAQLLDLWHRTRAVQLDLWLLLDAADAELTGELRTRLGEAIAGMSRALGAASDWQEWAARHLQLIDEHPDGPRSPA